MLAPAALLFCLTARAAEPAPAPSCDDPPGLLGSEDALAGRFRALLPAAEACAEREGLPPARRASSLVALARLRLAAGDAAGAEASLKRALAEVPGDAEASYWLARAARDRPDEALASAEASARRAADPRRRASARRLAAEIRLDLGDAAGARREAEAALADAPADLDAWAALARARRDDPKAAAQAAARAETAAAATPLWLRPAALRLCARIRQGLDDAPAAAADLAGALAVDPDDIDALESLVELRRAHPDLRAAAAPPAAASAPSPGSDGSDALLAFERSVEDEPEWRRGPTLLWLAGRWADRGDRKSAVRAFLRAQAYDWRSVRYAETAVRLGRTRRGPKIEALYRAAAEAHKALGDPAGAERVLRLAAAAAPDSPGPWGELARLALDGGRLDEALADSDRQLALLDGAEADGASRATAHRQRAWILRARRDDAGARDCFRRALAADPGDELSRRELTAPAAVSKPPSSDELEAALRRDAAAFCRGDALRAAPAAVALAFFERCLSSSPDDARLLADRGVARAAVGDLDGAIADLRRAVALDPGAREARISLTAALELRGSPPQYKEKTPARP